MSKKKRWTKEEIDILRSNYENNFKNICELLPERTFDSIKLKARGLDLSVAGGYRVKSDLSRLMNDDPVSYYWIGFLLADGHFYDNVRLVLMLSEKDSGHLEKFSRYVMCDWDGLKKTIFSCQDKVIVPKITRKFGISNRKTYVPCEIDWIRDDDLFLSLVVGFIDGDGCITRLTDRRDCNIRIKCHSSWIDNFQIMSDRICKMAGVKPSKAKINSQGYAIIAWCSNVVLSYLKNRGELLCLPMMDRKWSKIEHFVGKRERSKSNLEEMKRLIVSGCRNRDIARKLGLADSAVSLAIKRNNLREKKGGAICL